MTFDFAEPLAPGQSEPLFPAPIAAHLADPLVSHAPDLMAARSAAPQGKHSSGWEPTAYVASPEPVTHVAPEPVTYLAPEPVLVVAAGKHAAPRAEEDVAPEPAYVASPSHAYPDPFATPIVTTSEEPDTCRPAGRRMALTAGPAQALFVGEPSNYPGDPGYVGDDVPVLDLAPAAQWCEASADPDPWSADQGEFSADLSGAPEQAVAMLPHEEGSAGHRRSGTGRRGEARERRSHPVLFGVLGMLVGVAVSASLLLLVGPMLVTLA